MNREKPNDSSTYADTTSHKASRRAWRVPTVIVHAIERETERTSDLDKLHPFGLS